jgi:hypothetical protein
MTDKKSKCRFCGIEAYKTEEEATRKLIQVYKNLDRQREAWAIDVIKAAVQAIEDVVEGVYPMCIALPFDDSCIHDVSRTKEDGDCQQCIHEYLKETANALKGLIDD